MSILFIFLAILSLVFFYPSYRIIPSFNKRWRPLLWLLVFLLFSMLFTHHMIRGSGKFPLLSDITGALGYMSLGLMTILFCFTAVRDLFLLVSNTFRLIKSPAIMTEPLKNPARRGFMVKFSNMAILGLTGSSSAYGFFEAVKQPELIKQEIVIPNLHPDLRGITILQITDLHVGATIKEEFIKELVARCKELKPDLIALTGDLADGSSEALKKDVLALEELTPPLGKYFVTGNHEYYSDLKGWMGLIQELGFEILLNEHRIISRKAGSFTLAGVTDYHAGSIFPSHKSSVKTALLNSQVNIPKVLLAHQPKSIFEAADEGVDFQISGHTHGGQYFPGTILVRLDQPYVAGRYVHKNTQIYVSRGSGYWGPPLRIGSRSEITLFTLS